jgi:hypothetical protein
MPFSKTLKRVGAFLEKREPTMRRLTMNGLLESIVEASSSRRAASTATGTARRTTATTASLYGFTA